MSNKQEFKTAEEAFQAMLEASFGKAKKEAYKPSKENQNTPKKKAVKPQEDNKVEPTKEEKVEEEVKVQPKEEIIETPKAEEPIKVETIKAKDPIGIEPFLQNINIDDYKILNLDSKLADKLSTIAKIEKVKLQVLINNILVQFFDSKKDSLTRLKIGSAFKFSDNRVEQSEFVVPEKIENEQNRKSVKVNTTMYDNLQVLKIAYKIPVTTFFVYIVEEWLKEYKPILETKSYGVFLY